MASDDEGVYQPKDAISASARSTAILGAAIGGIFEFARIAAANLREKDDAYNPAIGGFFAGSIVGLRMRSFPAVLGFGTLLAILQGVFEYSGGALSGFGRDPSVDQYEHKEQLRNNRRRPIEETLREMGEGREIREQIVQLKSTDLGPIARDAAVAQCLASINDLKGEISSNTEETPAHDQRTFNEILTGLQKQLQEVRSEVVPKRKFAFKPKSSAAPAHPTLSTSDPASVASTSNQPAEAPSKLLSLEPAASTTSPGGFEGPCLLNDVHNGLKTESNVEHADRGIMMANSSHCIIRCAVPTPNLTIDYVQASLLLCGPVNGAVLVMGVTASVLAISCRQLRMHGCQKCTVYLQCSSKPIIEDCSGIRFAPFPKGLDTTSDQWDQIHDFNWLKAEHSPNWSILELENRKSSEQWSRLITVTEQEMDGALRDLGTMDPDG
ncbi:MAG: hypothetical protein Q9219_004269 [cf. Caloplaca sp. 3 TL-2023]